MKLPNTKMYLSLEQNPNKSMFIPLSEWMLNHDMWPRNENPPLAYMSDEETLKCLETDTIWVIQWYPTTSTSFYCLAASTLDKLLKMLKEDGHVKAR